MVGRYWDANAEAWTVLSRAGYDKYRDLVNSPAFLGMLPAVEGLRGLDIGCGEGHNTRLLGRRGARMAAIDIAPRFIAHAQCREASAPLGIAYQVASAVALPFPGESFDFATGFMSFMDIPEHDRVLQEAWRILRPGGFLQFSISHPCFATPSWEWVRDEAGIRRGLVCGDYFKGCHGEIEEWTFSTAPEALRAQYPFFRIPRFTRTLSSWLNLIMNTGFTLEAFAEPHADEDLAAEEPKVADTRIIAYFLIIRARKGRMEYGPR